MVSGYAGNELRHCNREVQLAMPSIEVCRVVRDLNQGSKCVTTDSASDGAGTDKRL